MYAFNPSNTLPLKTRRNNTPFKYSLHLKIRVKFSSEITPRIPSSAP